MSELRIYFLDLVAFVPAADGSYWILLPDARQQTLASDGITPIVPHYPIALFDLPNQGDSEWQQIYQLLQLNPPLGDHEAWILDRQELRISIPPALPAQAPGTSATGLPQPSNRTDFTWVPNLASTLGISAKVDPGCLLPAGLSSSGRPSRKIVSRLQIQGGTLATFQFVKWSLTTFPYSLRLPLLEFKALGGGPTFGTARACADAVVATIPFGSSTVDISAFDLDTDTLIRSISLVPGTSQPGVVNLLVGNLSPDPPASSITPRFGVHFERYYDLLANPPATRPIPYLVSGFPTNPATHISPTGINGVNPAFIQSALEIPFSGFNPPLCSLATLQP